MPLPLKDVSYCTLSADGNWIAFGGADVRGKWDVYFMNSSGGEVRRITQDSSDNVNVTHISRDGSWILFDRYHLGKSEIAIVPTLGGATRIICEGSGPGFDEVNQRIFYFGKGYSSPGRLVHILQVCGRLILMVHMIVWFMWTLVYSDSHLDWHQRVILTFPRW